MTDLDYAGDINPKEAWDLLKQEEDCYLVDCRTSAEWNFVGVPDLSPLGKKVFFFRMAKVSFDG